MQAVILAAGRGERIRPLAQSKPLLSLLGMSLLERNVRAAQLCGIDEILIVTGHESQRIEEWRHEFAKHSDAPTIRLVHNKHWANTENGQSLLAAKPFINRRFLLLMGDHVYTPELLQKLCQQSPPAEGAVLAVDGKLSRGDIDQEDVTHVSLLDQRVCKIDKCLSSYDGFDTGAFLCEPAIMATVESESAAGRTRLSDAMQTLAAAGKLLACRVDGHYWQDVDTPEMHRRAEQSLLDWAAAQANDGAVARWVNRPFSKLISRQLIKTKISPNQISLLAFGLGLLAALSLAQPHYWTLLLGGVLVQLASIIDGSDGEVARLRVAPSEYGGWLDALLDRYADAAVFAALTWHLMQAEQSMAWMWLGCAAISGSFIASYSAHKADQMSANLGWRIGRDTRSLAVMLGSIAARPDVLLWLVAIVMNTVVFYRIFSLRQKNNLSDTLLSTSTSKNDD